MAERPVFVAKANGPSFVWTHQVEFPWSKGLNIVQAQKNITALHEAAKIQLNLNDVLEISSKSLQPAGVKLSAFNLMIKTDAREFSVECGYQGSKVFERGGPYLDIFNMSSIDAKRDERLSHSGRLIKYKFYNSTWELEPRTAFYDWLYMNALYKNPRLAEIVLSHTAFTDIAFNPERSINCQAYAAALYVSLHKRGLLSYELLKDPAGYLDAIKGMKVVNSHENTAAQSGMFES